MMTLTTVGYGDIIPKGDFERWYCFVAMAIGGAFYGYMIGQISSTISARDLNAAAYTQRMESVRSWLYYHEELPISLRRRIKRHFQRHLTQKSATEDATIINDLSPALVHDVTFFLVPNEVRCNVLFHNLPNSVLAQIMTILEQKEAEIDEMLVEVGDPGTAMFIITKGSAHYVHGHQWLPSARKEEIEHTSSRRNAAVATEVKKVGPATVRESALAVGYSFGEECILGLEEVYNYTIRSITMMTLISISAKSFDQLFCYMPEMRKHIFDNFLVNAPPIHLHHRHCEMRGRSTMLSDGIPQLFPDTVLDSLEELHARIEKLDGLAVAKNGVVSSRSNITASSAGLQGYSSQGGKSDMSIRENGDGRADLPEECNDTRSEQSSTVAI
jgi:hypothetical protein